jgi:AP-2 complex subunit beta-1
MLIRLAQTFIRGAAGRALVDTPALNPLSRQLLVPIQREGASAGPLVVSGPGPIEPGTAPVPSPVPINTSKPAPPLPPDSGTGSLLEGSGEGGSGGEEDEDEDAGFAGRRSGGNAYLVPASDPYASLDAAFVDDSQNDFQLQIMRGSAII